MKIVNVRTLTAAMVLLAGIAYRSEVQALQQAQQTRIVVHDEDAGFAFRLMRSGELHGG